jgi:hypothetical protein
MWQGGSAMIPVHDTTLVTAAQSAGRREKHAQENPSSLMYATQKRTHVVGNTARTLKEAENILRKVASCGKRDAPRSAGFHALRRILLSLGLV